MGSATTLKDIMEEEHLFGGETEKEKNGLLEKKVIGAEIYHLGKEAVQL